MLNVSVKNTALFLYRAQSIILYLKCTSFIDSTILLKGSGCRVQVSGGTEPIVTPPVKKMIISHVNTNKMSCEICKITSWFNSPLPLP